MDIQRNNYEKYFLDYLDGKLSGEEKELLHQFLDAHPDLAEELQDFSLAGIAVPELPVKDMEYPGKELLKRESLGEEMTGNPEDASRRRSFLVAAYLEGDLDPREKSVLESELRSDPELAEELKWMKKTRLRPRPVVYPDISSLKRSRTVPLFHWRILVSVAAAASVALLLIIRLDRPTPDRSNTQEIAAVESINETTGESPGEKPSGTTGALGNDGNSDTSGNDTPGRAETGTENDARRSRETPASGSQKKEVRSSAGSPAIRLIRDTNQPVPVSTLKETTLTTAALTSTEKGSDKETGPARRGVISLEKTNLRISGIPSQELPLMPTPLPKINASSLSVTQLARAQLSRVNEMARQEDQLLFSLASAGIEEINKRTGGTMKLLASTSEEGNINGIEFRSRLLSVRAPIQREEN